MNNMILRAQNLYNTSHLSLTYFLALRRFWTVSFLVSSIFVSSIGVVYVKAMNRILYSDLQMVEKDRDNLAVKWGQLLLEQSTWATQSRIQIIAENRLNMISPEQNTVVMVKE
jgi:cell division protein FtsL